MDDSPHVPARHGDGDLVALYERQFAVMVGIGVDRYGLDVEEAERLAHEAFIGLLFAGDEIVDRERWLLGALESAGRRLPARNEGKGAERERP